MLSILCVLTYKLIIVPLFLFPAYFLCYRAFPAFAYLCLTEMFFLAYLFSKNYKDAAVVSSLRRSK